MSLQQLHERGIATLQICSLCGRCYDHTAGVCEEHGASLQTNRILPFKILDRYRLAHFLGQGGMGTVFKAYDEKLHRFVAVKIIKSELLNDLQMRARLEREAHLVARLRHPGIIDVHDFGELADSSAFLVMEFLQGLDLAQILKQQGSANPTQVAMVLTQVSDALSHAHAAGIIHRDLKPANLFLVPLPVTFQIRVVDFGLAKPIGENTGLTSSGMIVGSLMYMSPEQIRHEPVDERRSNTLT